MMTLLNKTNKPYSIKWQRRVGNQAFEKNVSYLGDEKNFKSRKPTAGIEPWPLRWQSGILPIKPNSKHANVG